MSRGEVECHHYESSLKIIFTKCYIPLIFHHLGIFRLTVWSCCRKPRQVGIHINPDSKVPGANMGPTWVLLAPDGPHVDPLLSGNCRLKWLLRALVATGPFDRVPVGSAWPGVLQCPWLRKALIWWWYSIFWDLETFDLICWVNKIKVRFSGVAIKGSLLEPLHHDIFAIVI